MKFPLYKVLGKKESLPPKGEKGDHLGCLPSPPLVFLIGKIPKTREFLPIAKKFPAWDEKRGKKGVWLRGKRRCHPIPDPPLPEITFCRNRGGGGEGKEQQDERSQKRRCLLLKGHKWSEKRRGGGGGVQGKEKGGLAIAFAGKEKGGGRWWARRNEDGNFPLVVFRGRRKEPKGPSDNMPVVCFSKKGKEGHRKGKSRPAGSAAVEFLERRKRKKRRFVFAEEGKEKKAEGNFPATRFIN